MLHLNTSLRLCLFIPVSIPPSKEMWKLTFCFLLIYVCCLQSIAISRITPLGNTGIIRIQGKIIERNSQNPFKEVHVIAKSGGTVVASIFSNRQGEFVISIPAEKVVGDHFTLRIKHKNHIFIKEDITVESDGILVEINGEIFLDDPEEYQLPIHMLDQPQVGSVTIWFRNGSQRRIMN